MMKMNVTKKRKPQRGNQSFCGFSSWLSMMFSRYLFAALNAMA